MIIKHLFRFASVAVLSLVVAVSARAQNEDMVKAEVTVSASDGTVFPGRAVVVVVNDVGIVDAETDGQGQATLMFPMLLPSDVVKVAFGYAEQDSKFTPKDQLRIARDRDETERRYHFFRSVPIVIPASRRIAVNISAIPAIDVRLMVVDEKGNPRRTTYKGRSTSSLGFVEKGVVYPASGLPQGMPFSVWIMVEDEFPRRIIRVIDLNAEQTQQNVNLGTIEIPSLEGGEAINGFIINQTQRRKLTKGIFDGVTMVAEDGSTFLSFRALVNDPASARPDGPTPFEAKPDEPNRVPAGTYYVAPDYFLLPTENGKALINMVRRGVDLSGTDIPRVTIKAGEPNEFTIDMLAAHHAIQEAIMVHHKEAADTEPIPVQGATEPPAASQPATTQPSN